MQILIIALLCGICSVKSGNKIESLQERAIRSLPEDNSLCYEDLFEKARNLKMRVSNIRILCIEIYKTTNSLNLSFMSNIFKEKLSQRLSRDKCRLNLDIPNWNLVTFGAQSLEAYGPKIWHSVSNHIESI